MSDAHAKEGDRVPDDEDFWAHAEPSMEPAKQRGFLPPIALALLLSVPWYWGDEAPVVLGMPAWVWVCLLCTAFISATTARAAFVHWRDDEPPPQDRTDG